jgi:cell division septation protein DedD
MRNLFFVLVLANLAFAAWRSWFSPDAALDANDGDVPTIMLAREFPVAEQEVATPPVVEAELDSLATAPAPPTPGENAELEEAVAALEALSIDAEPAADTSAATEVDTSAATEAAIDEDEARVCVSVGPFRELSQAATAAANLRGTGLDPVQRAGEGDIWVGYWVYLAALPSVAEAETILARLKESGISEAYVIPNSDSGTLISLGVFTEVARAGNRLSAARELGYEATISDRTRRGTVYWVDVLLAPGETLDFDALQPPGRIVRLEQRPCAATLD